MEIPLLSRCDSMGTRRNNAPVSGNIFYTIIVFTRDARFSRKYERERGTGARGGGWRKEAREERNGETREAEEKRARKRVDNSQDRIVPGAKNRSIPECYRMAETLASRELLHLSY